jgi:hypothetical protein
MRILQSDGEQYGWLVIARSPRGVDFPTYTITGTASGEEAMECVLHMGFCFTRRAGWTLRALRVALLPDDRSERPGQQMFPSPLPTAGAARSAAR